MGIGRVMEAAADLLREGRGGAFVTVVSTSGSVPRKAGAKMLVADDGHITGTVGGGIVEAELIAAALDAIRTGEPALREFELTPAAEGGALDLLCGGRMAVFIEPLAARDELLIFGAGHVALALAEVCARLDFAVTVTDDRAEFANSERYPMAARIIVAPFAEQCAQLAPGPRSYVVIVTRGHSHDELCLEAALRSRARHISMIGSRRKVAAIRQRLRDKGFGEADIARFETPAGLDIGAETPEEIAISIAARLIEVRRKGA